MRYFVLAALVPAALSAQPLQDSARPISLGEAVQLAQQNAPQMVAARNNINANEATVRTRWSAFLPTLSGNVSSSWGAGQVFDNKGDIVSRNNVTPWNWSRRVSANWLVFDGGDRNFQLRAARANVDAAEANAVATEFSVAYSVSQQFYAALAARESRAAAVTALAEAEQNQRAANARIASGAATRSDSLRAVISVGNQQLAVMTAENDLQNANAALTRLVGTPFTVTAAESDTALSPVSVDSVELARLLDSSPAMRSAQASVAAASAGVRSSRTDYWPSITTSYGLTNNIADTSFAFWQGRTLQNKSFSLSMSVPIFNGLGREETVQRAKITEMNARATLRDAQLLAQQQLVQYLGQLRLAQARIAILQASLEAAQEDLRVQQQRYALGASTQLELLTTQTQLNSARYNLVNARYQVRIAKAQLEQLLGREIR
ncbi:MAG TPA: TolC family protein [Gemmatimonadaceae bacterium]|nr:TolC family protein [Gemmatimonadaceae bacterium]